jgi:hexosaminidase
MTKRKIWRVIVLTCSAAIAVAAAVLPAWNGAPVQASGSGVIDIVPAPVSLTPSAGVSFSLGSAPSILAPGSSWQPGHELELTLRTVAHLRPVVWTSAAGHGSPAISLVLLTHPDAQLGDEGYRLDVTAQGVRISANTTAGLFEGSMTLAQLAAENAGGDLPGVQVLDYPRYAYRGVMLDVARHFFTVAQVEHFISEIAVFKINYLHLHLSDDQGWRIAIKGWPQLTQVGGSTEEGGGQGGYYTQAQYQQIVAYAEARNVTIVPEIDVPAHSGAALASYAKLNCDGKAPPVFTGIGSAPDGTLCVTKPVTYKFLNDVISQLAALTPGPYMDVGGDEASSLSTSAYDRFESRVQAIVTANHKRLFGWAEMLTGVSPAGATGEFWIYDGTQNQVATASQDGADLVMAPCIFAYLDQKYAPNRPAGPLGLDWAGFISVQASYGWDPTEVLAGVPAFAISGVEGALWTDTVRNLRQAQKLGFPRVAALAEIGWSPLTSHNWASFQQRLGAQEPLLTALTVHFYHSPDIPWQSAG